MVPIYQGPRRPGNQCERPALQHHGPAQWPPAPEDPPPRNRFRRRIHPTDRSNPDSQPSRQVDPDFRADLTCPTGPRPREPGSINPDTTGGRFLPGTLATIGTTENHETKLNATPASPIPFGTLETSGPQMLRGQSVLVRCRHLKGVRPMLANVSLLRAMLANVMLAHEILAAMSVVRLAVLLTGAERNLRRVDTTMRRRLIEMAVQTVVHRRAREALLTLQVAPTRGLPESPLFPRHRRHPPHKVLLSIPSAHGSSIPNDQKSSIQPELLGSMMSGILRPSHHPESNRVSDLRGQSHQGDLSGHR